MKIISYLSKQVKKIKAWIYDVMCLDCIGHLYPIFDVVKHCCSSFSKCFLYDICSIHLYYAFVTILIFLIIFVECLFRHFNWIWVMLLQLNWMMLFSAKVDTHTFKLVVPVCFSCILEHCNILLLIFIFYLFLSFPSLVFQILIVTFPVCLRLHSRILEAYMISN